MCPEAAQELPGTARDARQEGGHHQATADGDHQRQAVQRPLEEVRPLGPGDLPDLAQRILHGESDAPGAQQQHPDADSQLEAGARHLTKGVVDLVPDHRVLRKRRLQQVSVKLRVAL